MRTGKLSPQLLGRPSPASPARTRGCSWEAASAKTALIDFMTPPPHGGAPEQGPETRGPAGPSRPGHPRPEPLGAGPGAGGNDRLLVAKTDPITFATDLIGWYAVHVNANDVACAGATPRWFMATALLPERWEESEVAALFEQLTEACTSLGVTLVGGHTEITGGLERPVLSGCMLGEVERARAVRTGGGQAGDDLILNSGNRGGGDGHPGPRGHRGPAREGGPGRDGGARPRAPFNPGISVVPAARLLCHVAPPPEGVHSLHDPRKGASRRGSGR